MSTKDKPQSAIQSMTGKELPIYQSKEWFDMPNKEKISLIARGRPLYQDIDWAANIINSGMNYHLSGMSYEEGLEVMVLAFHQQLNSMYKERIDAAMLSTEARIFIDPSKRK